MSKTPDRPYQTTLHIRDHCLCLHTQRAARALARHFDEAFRPLDLTNGQFSLLTSLDRPEPPTIGSVAALLAMDRTTLTAGLKPLERRGLIVVKEDSMDRRSRRLSLTKKGQALLSKAVPIWRSTHDDVDALLAGTVVNLPNGLRKLSELLQQS
jgi:DNA-binding MarR family transcriptional regulator